MNQRYRSKNKKNNMAKTITTNTTRPDAWIVNPKDKGRISIKNGKCFLKNNSPFEIELFNPLTVSVLSDIKLNGNSISKTGLIVKPGQRIYLDCFIDDKKKFIFSTYEIDNNQESLNAIQKNGILEVFFYKEEVINLNNWKSIFDKIIIEKWYPVYYPKYVPYYPSYPWIYDNYNYNGNCNVNYNGNLTVGTTTNNYSLNNSSYTSKNSFSCSCGNIETGRIEKGSSSSQKFTDVNMDFENNYISSTIIQILPESRRPIEIKTIKTSKEDKNDTINLIKKLSDLHLAGILTDDEFSTKKAELLSKI